MTQAACRAMPLSQGCYSSLGMGNCSPQPQSACRNSAVTSRRLVGIGWKVESLACVPSAWRCADLFKKVCKISGCWSYMCSRLGQFGAPRSLQRVHSAFSLCNRCLCCKSLAATLTLRSVSHPCLLTHFLPLPAVRLTAAPDDCR